MMSVGSNVAIFTEAGYVMSFGFSAVICLIAFRRAQRIDNTDIRVGLVWLLATTGIWALLKTAYFLFSGSLSEAAYSIGLVSGFATVWAWLYFCSAYTCREYHHNDTLRKLGAGVFLSVVAVKLTNPIHGLYFTTQKMTMPFPHLAIEHGVFHWAATGLSYILAAVGLFMLFEFYYQSGYSNKPLVGLTILLGIPVMLDIVALLTPRLINVIYAPLGVAAFAVGALFVFRQRFAAVGTTVDDDAVAVFVDGSGTIQEYTASAVDTFPELSGAVGEPLSETLPSITAALEEPEDNKRRSEPDGGKRVVERKSNDESQYFVISTRSTTTGEAAGQVITLSDEQNLNGSAGSCSTENENLPRKMSYIGPLSRRVSRLYPESMKTRTLHSSHSQCRTHWATPRTNLLGSRSRNSPLISKQQ